MGASDRLPVVLLLCLGVAVQSCDSTQTTIGILLAAGGQTPAGVDVSGTSRGGSAGIGERGGAGDGGAGEPDPCAEEPCQNDGECTPAESGFTCACRPGFDGALCETDVDDCVDAGCENGECVDGVASFACACDPAFVGERCELARLAALSAMPPYSFASAISSDGRVLVGASDFGADIGSRPFRWTAEEGVRQLVGEQPFVSGTALDVSGDGSVIVGSVVIAQGIEDGFRWTEESGLTLLGAGDFAEARGVSADGSTIIGRFSSGDTLDLFRWTEPTRLRDVGTMSGGSLLALGVSADASIVVGFGTTEDQFGVAFRWTEAEGFQALFPDITPTSASAISGDGTTIVGHYQDEPGADRHAFTWTAESGRRPIPVGNLSLTEARSVSHDGSIIVGMSTEGGWIYDGEGNALLLLDVLEELGADIEGWVFLDPSDISADGTVIAGYGEHAQTGVHGFIARLAAD